MFAHLLKKEWKDKAAVFGLALGLVVVCGPVFFALARKQAAPDLLTLPLSLIVVPLAGLLMGSGSFDAEFRNGAWTFLFSRPVRRGTIWLAKLVAALSMYLAVFGAARLVIALWPGFANASPEILWNNGITDARSMPLLGFLAGLLALSFAFVLSFALDRPLVVAFLAIFATVLVGGGWFSFFEALSQAAAPGRESSTAFFFAFPALLAVAMIAGSFLMFRRADVSQPRSRLASLGRWAGAFAAAAMVLTAGGVKIYGLTAPNYGASIVGSDGTIWIGTFGGLYRYDADSDRIGRKLRFGWAFTLKSTAGRLLFEGADSSRGPSHLWMVAGEQTPVVLDDGLPALQNPRLESRYVGEFDFSPDARRVVFTTLETRLAGGRPAKLTKLWTVRSDGTRLREVSLTGLSGRTLPGYGALLGWISEAGDDIMIEADLADPPPYGGELWRINVETGGAVKAADGVRRVYPYYQANVLAGTPLIELDRQRKERTLALWAPDATHRTEIARSPSFGAVFVRPDGRRVIYTAYPSGRSVREARSYLYDTDDGRPRELTGTGTIANCAWFADGSALLVVRAALDDEERAWSDSLVLMGADGRLRAVDAPFIIKEGIHIAAAGNVAAVLSWKTNRVWRYRASDGNWKKIL